MAGIFAVLLVLQAASTQAGTPPPPPPAPTPAATCEGGHFDEFDFWVGQWDVYPTGKDQIVAHSRIEKLYGGCALRENWMPLKGAGGGSLSGYDPRTGGWHQTWFGSSPGPVFFSGGLASGQMVLTGSWPGSGPKGEDGLTRMTYSRLENGAVRQHGEFSGDYGVTWQTSFDLTYRPHEEPHA
ncbi:MAG: hypothetical protein IE933_02635 [Sphingomonadales bacterium]|nr:hypothetical protein [Sphingomonadales bacterium]MBD3775081.1 hypothetical protein [Paracoccaceae bacterium]